MVIKPEIDGFICRTAHPLGCEARVREEIDYVKSAGVIKQAVMGADPGTVAGKASRGSAVPKNVLVIGCSTGYGLSAAIAAAWGYEANVVGVCRERPASPSKDGKPAKTASAGFYNIRALEKISNEDGKNITILNEDAFLTATKRQVIDVIKDEMGCVDLVIYSLAAPKRTLDDGTTYKSVLKTTGTPFVGKDLNLRTLEIEETTIECATDEEIENSIKVMGGEDWYEWIKLLYEAGAIADGSKTVAFSYIGPELTYPIYDHGTMGFAKRHLYETSKKISEDFGQAGIKGFISMNKSMVTQASIAIPRAPIYIALLRKIMTEDGSYEGCIQQMYRLFNEKLAPGEAPVVDDKGMIRLDDYELMRFRQDEAIRRMEAMTTETANELAGLDLFFGDFYRMFGFGFDGVDYEADVEI